MYRLAATMIMNEIIAGTVLGENPGKIQIYILLIGIYVAYS